MNPKHRMLSLVVCGALLLPAWMAMGQTPPPADAQTPSQILDNARRTMGKTAPPAKAQSPAQTLDSARRAADKVAPSADVPTPAAAPDAPPAELKTLDQEVQGLKKDVVDLNKDLFVLQEELLFPANTQVALYISMDVGTFFALDSVTVKIDNKEVKNYLYTAREADALLKGGVQQIYLGNLKVGKHELVAFFTGKGPVERDYKRGATINFDKGVGAKYLELKVTDHVPKHQPEFMIKDWE
jgi:hypothetical protein